MTLEYRYNALNVADAKVVDFVIGRLMGKPMANVEAFVKQLETQVAAGASVKLAGEPVSPTAVKYLIDHIKETGGLK
jgi:hypothetical protein